MTCVLVSCCGLPAAGKTSFCRTFTDSAAYSGTIRTSSTLLAGFPVIVSHVCFDDHISLAHERSRRLSRETAATRAKAVKIGSPSHESNRARPSDAQQGADIESVLRSEGSNGIIERTPREGDGPSWWHEGRRDAMAVVASLAARYSASRTAVTGQRVGHGGQEIEVGVATVPEEGDGRGDNRRARSNEKRQVLHVVLVDDNMHFRSMRHEVQRLARTYGCSYAQVYFPMDMGVAIERDAARKASVSEAVIRKMAANLQPPDPDRFVWERYTAVIGPCALQLRRNNSISSTAATACGHDRVSASAKVAASVAECEATAMRSFWEVIAAAADDPVRPLPPISSEADRAATSASRLHRLDLHLREAVQKVAKAAVSANITPEVLREVMSACSLSRKTAMRWARAPGKEYAGHTGGSDGGTRNDGALSSGTGDGSKSGGGRGPSSVIDSKERRVQAIISGHRVVADPQCCRHNTEHGACPFDVFAIEFETAVRTMERLNSSVRQTLVSVARELPRHEQPR